MKIEVDPNKSFNKINHFNEPRTDVNSVLCFYHGKFPKITRPDKDVTLPHRLFPNAKLFIRCNTNDSGTKTYLHELFKDKCEIELIHEALNCSKLDVDVLYIQQDCWLFFGGIIEKGAINNALMLQKWNKEAYIFYNDESLGTFDSMYNIMQYRKDSGKFKESNQYAYMTINDKKDWSNVHLICNENKITDWMNDRVSNSLKDKQIQIDYLSDIILYDLKMPIIDKYPKTRIDCGVFIGSFHQTRARAWNKIFTDSKQDFEIDVYGNGSDKINHYTGDGKYLSNQQAIDFYSKYRWSIYMGKGTPSLYLGATFFEPILNYCPLFVWTGTDPEKKLFPELDCYFSTQQELYELIYRQINNPSQCFGFTLWFNQLLSIFKKS